jgi:secondary thiamine-phosphate synthase enzyme
MKIHSDEFAVKTTEHSQMLDITSEIVQIVADSGIGQGLVVVHVPHTTAGVTINENADADVRHDILAALDHAVPWRQGFYQHNEGNSAAHVKSSLVGCTQLLLVEEGELALGTWQGVFFCEFDGPRNRRVMVRVQG